MPLKRGNIYDTGISGGWGFTLSDEIRIDSLSASQWEIYRDIRLEGLKNDPEAFASSYEEEAEFGEDVWIRRIPNAIFAFSGNNVVGVISCTSSNRMKVRHTYDINGFYVRKEYRNRGVGMMLLEGAISFIRENPQIRKINLSVSSTQSQAISLYLKMGFVKIGEATDQFLVNGRFSNEIFMELMLPNSE